MVVVLNDTFLGFNLAVELILDLVRSLCRQAGLSNGKFVVPEDVLLKFILLLVGHLFDFFERWHFELGFFFLLFLCHCLNPFLLLALEDGFNPPLFLF